MMLLIAPVYANEQQVDAELLEFLGEWNTADEDWSDPVDILDMNFEDNKRVVTEKKDEH